MQNGWVSDAEDFVRVLTTTSVPEGHLAKALLESEGISVMLKGEGEGPYRMGPVHLFVPAGLEVQAQLVLDAVNAAQPEGRALDEEDDEALAEEGNEDL